MEGNDISEDYCPQRGDLIMNWNSEITYIEDIWGQDRDESGTPTTPFEFWTFTVNTTPILKPELWTLTTSTGTTIYKTVCIK